MSWEFIPAELRSRAQWAVAGVDKAPQWLSGERLRYISVVEPSQWGSFEQAAQVAHANGMSLGYILSSNDPFACIDLDVKETTTQESLSRFRSIVDHMQSYSEVSRSGNGIHIWVKGKIGQGVRRDGVEVYSQERFIICTGKTINGHAIEDRQDMLLSMVQQMRPVRDALSPPLVEVEPIELDIDIINRGFYASNGDKFKALWLGDWKDLGYPSQSEADYALINMLAFYSESNEQVRRLFRESALGQRKKAHRDDYINRALRVVRQELDANKFVDISAMQAAMETMKLVEEYVASQPEAPPPPLLLSGPEVDVPLREPFTGYVDQTPDPSRIDWPPGFIGYLAKTIYAMAPRPVKEIAIATAIAHMAGLSGRAWNISGTGLNIYIAIVARSATGKNIIHSAMKKLAKACGDKFPMYRNFIDGSNYVSAEGFEKSFRSRPSSVHHIPEFGKLLSRMNNGRDQIMENYARSLLGVYDVSGKDDSVGDIVKAKKEDSVTGVMGPVAFSLIGESTPEVFRRAVTTEAIEDGLMSRFFVVEYKGDRTARNESPAVVPHEVRDWLVQLAQHATQMINRNQVQDVIVLPEAKMLADAFDKYCDERIIGQKVEAKRFAWNRAHLMALKIAGILAVADNFYDPVVTQERMRYALDLVKHSIEARLPTLDTIIPETDEGRIDVVKRLIADYLFGDNNYGEELLHAVGAISYRLISQRVHGYSAFKEAPQGAIAALKGTIQALVDSGLLTQMPKRDTWELFKKSGQIYQVNMGKEDFKKIYESEGPDTDTFFKSEFKPRLRRQ